MAATMATLNVVAASSAVAAVASPPTVAKSSFGGQRLVAGRGVSVAVRRPVVVVRASDVRISHRLQVPKDFFSDWGGCIWMVQC